MTSSLPSRRRFAAGGAALALLAVLVAGCSPDSGANLVSPDDKTTSTTVENNANEGAENEGDESSPGDADDSGSVGQGQNEESAEQLPYPGPEQFKEEIELAKTMTAEEVQEYGAQKAEELEAEFAEATAEEEAERIAAIEELDEEFVEKIDAFVQEYEAALEEAGPTATPDEMEEIERRFAERRVAINSDYEDGRIAIDERFNEQTADVQAEFEPKYLEAQARMEYMVKAQEEAN